MANINLTRVVDKYVKSATGGLNYTDRVKKILSIIIIPIWLFCLSICVLSAIDGIEGIQNIKIAKRLLSDVPTLEKNREIRNLKDGETTRELLPINLGLYKKLGIDNPDPTEAGMPDLAISKQKDKIYSLLLIPLYLGIFIVLPWIILRIFFWIKHADNKM